MKSNRSLSAVFRAVVMVCAGTASSVSAVAAVDGHSSTWYIRDAYSTPDSVQSIGAMGAPRARWVAPPPPAAAGAPPPPPAPYVEPVAYVDPFGWMFAGSPGVGGEGGGHEAEGPGFGGGGGGDGGGGCFLTTATVKAMGKADDGEELTMARFLRDQKMNDAKGRAATELYYLVGPTIVGRKQDWKDFYAKCVQPLTVMVKAGHYDLAIQRYSLETAKLIDEHATRYDDKELVQAVYDYAFGKDSFKTSALPYGVKYAKLKAALKAKIVVGEGKLDRKQAALGLAV